MNQAVASKGRIQSVSTLDSEGAVIIGEEGWWYDDGREWARRGSLELGQSFWNVLGIIIPLHTYRPPQDAVVVAQ